MDSKQSTEERLLNCENKLKDIKGQLMSISGRLICFMGNDAHHKRTTASYLRNQNKQIYEMKQAL